MNVLGKVKNLRLTGKMVSAMMFAGMLPLIVASVVIGGLASNALKDAATNQLDSLVAVKKTQVESYFDQIRKQAITFSEDKMVVDAMSEFSDSFAELGAYYDANSPVIESKRRQVDDFYKSQFKRQFQTINSSAVSVAALVPNTASEIIAQQLYIANNDNPLGSKDTLNAANDGSVYSQVHSEYHPIFRNFLKKFGYYDIFLVEPTNGNIVYSVFKEVDFATSLKNGPYKDTNFSRAVEQAKLLGPGDSATLVDFEPYLPSYDGPASFIASPIYDGSSLKGVLVFQMPLDEINAIMQERSGLGETGETYLVGQDLLMRSQSRFTEENTILSREIDTEATRAIALGHSGSKIVDDFNGLPAISSYAPIAIAGLDWGLVAEINRDEALAAVTTLTIGAGIVGVVAAFLLLLMAMKFAKNLIRPVTNSVQLAQNIADGQLRNELPPTSNDEIGDLIMSLGTMQDNLRARIEADKEALAENGRIRQALDNVNGCVMIADNDQEIIYANDAMTSLFAKIEVDVRSSLPSFSARKIIGRMFHLYTLRAVHGDQN